MNNYNEMKNRILEMESGVEDIVEQFLDNQLKLKMSDLDYKYNHIGNFSVFLCFDKNNNEYFRVNFSTLPDELKIQVPSDRAIVNPYSSGFEVLSPEYLKFKSDLITYVESKLPVKVKVTYLNFVNEKLSSYYAILSSLVTGGVPLRFLKIIDRYGDLRIRSLLNILGYPTKNKTGITKYKKDNKPKLTNKENRELYCEFGMNSKIHSAKGIALIANHQIGYAKKWLFSHESTASLLKLPR